MIWLIMSDLELAILVQGCKGAYHAFLKMIASLILWLMLGLKRLAALPKVRVILYMEVKLPVPVRQLRLVPQLLLQAVQQPVQAVQQPVQVRQLHLQARLLQVVQPVVQLAQVRVLQPLRLLRPVQALAQQLRVLVPVVQLQQVLQQPKPSRRGSIWHTK